jgi:hypothetical protein
VLAPKQPTGSSFVARAEASAPAPAGEDNDAARIRRDAQVSGELDAVGRYQERAALGGGGLMGHGGYTPNG